MPWPRLDRLWRLVFDFSQPQCHGRLFRIIEGRLLLLFEIRSSSSQYINIEKLRMVLYTMRTATNKVKPTPRPPTVMNDFYNRHFHGSPGGSDIVSDICDSALALISQCDELQRLVDANEQQSIVVDTSHAGASRQGYTQSGHPRSPRMQVVTLINKRGRERRTASPETAAMHTGSLHCYGLYSDGLYSYGLYHGLYSYGLYSYDLRLRCTQDRNSRTGCCSRSSNAQTI